MFALAATAQFCSSGRRAPSEITPLAVESEDAIAQTGAGRPAPGADNADRETRASDKIRFKEKLALGSGYLAIFYGNSGVKSLAIPVYQMVLGVNPAVLGLVLAIPRFWDALTDPVVGIISDNCHTRFGRRKPIIILGALLQAVASPTIAMDRYTHGFTLAESLYAASHFVGWTDLVIGDPLTRPYPSNP